MSSSSVLGQSPCKLSSDLNSPSATQMRRSATEPSSRPSPAHGSNKGRGHGEGNDNKKLRPVDLSKHLLKTKVCSLYLEGRCHYGSKCFFAHSTSELQQQPNLKKTSLCRLYRQGKCNKGAACTYAHSAAELRATEKTVMCIWWLSGHCSHGSKCRFAHGEAELRSPPKSDSTVSSVAESSPRSEVSQFDSRMTGSHSSNTLASSPYGFEHAATFNWSKASDPVEEELCETDEFGTSPANLLPSSLTHDIIDSDPEEEQAELERNFPRSPFEMVRGAPTVAAFPSPAPPGELPQCIGCQNTVSNVGDVLCQRCLAGCCAAITSGDNNSFLISM
ncbi:conserved hypothetical protein [Perkinsus marinus ATCC 50983]|uniref:C3H1-type domain-containing protein n=1 Tax=Perkinsus marinus (strain ATCC 50983 / TXsc) TaxID=423536 RepID=C5L8W9_PERM5|nr:conserved hypothetical protein [Perkinsus marinus ATCC 50983]EER06827.1 conserved hypothetical protein [Perkinsus marinus ATCC 50983]|eukprot:XP_002775011.1 conserved hypothetical protein [Perkinsus marinus ATCC 50983]